VVIRRHWGRAAPVRRGRPPGSISGTHLLWWASRGDAGVRGRDGYAVRATLFPAQDRTQAESPQRPLWRPGKRSQPKRRITDAAKPAYREPTARKGVDQERG